MSRLLPIVFLVSILVLPDAWADPVIYSRPFLLPANFAASLNDTSQPGSPNFATVYDNFHFTDQATVTDVHWTGLNDSPGGTNPALTAFSITFYDNDAGLPGTQLYFQKFTGNAGETLLPTSVFSYSVDLSTPIVFSGGTTYWMSVVADFHANLDDDFEWSWASAYKGGKWGIHPECDRFRPICLRW